MNVPTLVPGMMGDRKRMIKKAGMITSEGKLVLWSFHMCMSELWMGG